MRNINMSYYNVYYYCNIIDNLLRLFTTEIEWASTGAEFLDWFYEGDIENFPKYSALHSFCDYAIRKLISEEDERELEIIQEKYDSDYAQTLDSKARIKYAFSSEYPLNKRLWIDRLLSNYKHTQESFYSFVKDYGFKFVDDAYSDYCFFNGEYDDAVSRRLTDLTRTANLQVRELGFKPYIAPGLSSAAVSNSSLVFSYPTTVITVSK